ncbi:DUF3466 family protein [Vibrio taketomensis]|uniref:DUF3466 family protein n=1 Tax=Vibrio taketomensis TaxID=2572923 RepID=UPI001E49AB9A|nr:DUF3466 family protein [Vibrio taketomensis]
MNAQAALYKVVEIDQPYGNSEYYGTAVQPSAAGESCFSSECTDTQYKISAETRNWPAGLSYREEVPFALDNGFDYAAYDAADFENYCDNHLGYAICDTWAQTQYSGYRNELDGNYKNSIAFIEGGAKISDDNAVINSLTSGTSAIGNKRDGSRRNIAFQGTTPLTDPSGTVSETHAFAANTNYIVGSVSFNNDQTTDGFEAFYSKPVIWNSSGAVVAQLPYGSGGIQGNLSDHLGQGSLRDFYVLTTPDSDGNEFIGVGYNTYTDQEMNATIFVGKLGDLTQTESVPVLGATVDDDYTNSVVSAVNNNGIAVGSAKRSERDSGSYNNRLFSVSGLENAATTAPRANFFTGGIFFNGSGGTIGSINNFNEVVGKTDLTQDREVNGTQRPQRGFINPLSYTGTDSTRRALFQNKAWFLDDLTNGGSYSNENNQFRIIDATDINDAGVISATAYKCPGGFENTNIDAKCSDANSETVVAVKLIPNSNADEQAISARAFSPNGGFGTIKREGGSLGWLALGLLAVLGFRRKR